MSDSSRPHRHNMHEHRYQSERLVYAVDECLRQALPQISLPDLIEARKRLINAGITEKQVASLRLQTEALTSTDRARLEDFYAWKVPVETVVEYLSSPNLRQGSEAPVREEVFNRIFESQRQHGRSLMDEGLPRSLYVGAYLAAITAIPLAATRAATLSKQGEWYVRPLAKFFTQVEELLPGLANMLGQDAVNTLASGVLGTSVVVAAGLFASYNQRSRHRAQASNLAGRLTEPTSGVAQELFGDARHSQVWSRYQRLGEGHKHLLSHLSAHELRVVLTGGPQAAREVLTARPVSYQQQVRALAHDTTSSLEFLARMMELSLPEFLKLPTRQMMEGLGAPLTEDRPVERVINAAYQTAPSNDTSSAPSFSRPALSH